MAKATPVDGVPFFPYLQEGMGMEKDLVAKEYLEDAEHFCGFVNGVLFDGDEQIQPCDVKSIPTELVYVAGGMADATAKKSFEENTDIMAPSSNKRQTTYAINRFRDQAKEVEHPDGKIIVAIQNQEKTDFEMPLRVMLEDALAYNEQRQLLYKKHYPKNGKLPLVVTIVFCYKTKGTGATDMEELVDVPKSFKKLKKYRPRYPMILVTPENMDTAHFPEDWKEIFEILKRQDKGRELEKYIRENKEKLNKLASDTKHFLNVMLDIRELHIKTAKEDKEEMCKAIEEIMEYSREEGLLQGKAEGQTTERISSIRNVMDSLKTTVEQAMLILKIPEGERAKCASMVQK